MKAVITKALVDEHKLILRMIALLERNAALTTTGLFSNWQFYLDGVEFIRNYADRFHHAKEEDVLFEALVKNGMPREHSPVAAMLMEHDKGRAYVKGMEAGAKEALAGLHGRENSVARNALSYASLLREHIDKEDTILYPLAERLIPESMRDEILAEYERAELRVSGNSREHYQNIVEGYEQEKIRPSGLTAEWRY
ncbi:hemerythrin HHE cation binding domain protein [Geobacter sp. OR-1]|uniref:hemerythrin domain-containing protein n=1 Tax=Geobacter sp. OR-1 TaxID=1266765 RepID=UPI000542ADB9|nr:hemerythrin domain-containing protein [Geobacter sp. OR-1]GAM09075.1 hemerythrin HHE cation binding domain protein [Geobacter sp. OR-1]